MGNRTCGLRAGALYCWGSDYFPSSFVPNQVGTANTWTQLTVGNSHRCGVNQGFGYCWGSNASGQLGDGTQGPSTSAVLGNGWQLLAAGAQHTCGIRAGALDCWGENRRAQTGASVTWSPIELSF